MYCDWLVGTTVFPNHTDVKTKSAGEGVSAPTTVVRLHIVCTVCLGLMTLCQRSGLCRAASCCCSGVHRYFVLIYHILD